MLHGSHKTTKERSIFDAVFKETSRRGNVRSPGAVAQAAVNKSRRKKRKRRQGNRALV